MAYINDTPITADDLIQFDIWLLSDYHDDELDEPYEGAGFCVCAICQEIAPRIMASALRIEELQAENARLRYLLYAVLEEQACGIPDRVISDTLENEILSATKGVTP